MHLTTAWNLEKGSMTFHGYSTAFFQNGVNMRTNRKQTYWDLQGAVTFHFASGKHVEWGVTQLIYRDNHKGVNQNQSNFPDDLFLKMKVGSIGKSTSPLKLGLTLAGRIPLANKHNLIFEPYSGNNLEAGMMIQLSYSPDLLIPESAFNIHVNLGFWYHNDTGDFPSGKPPVDKIFVTNPSTKLLYGVGLAFPTKYFDSYWELTGQAFLNRPPVTVYSREDVIYFSPSVKYRPSRWISFLFGLDLRLSQFKDTTLYERDGTSLPRISEDLTNYPWWRVRFGMQFNLLKPAPQLGTSSVFEKIGQNSENVDFLNSEMKIEENFKEQQELVKARLKAESAEKELQQIREERESIQKIIDRLKKMIYSDGEEQEKKEADSKKVTEKKPQK